MNFVKDAFGPGKRERTRTPGKREKVGRPCFAIRWMDREKTGNERRVPATMFLSLGNTTRGERKRERERERESEHRLIEQ